MRENATANKREQSHLKLMERVYSNYATYYDLFFDEILKPGRREAVQALEVTSEQNILEVGIGTGLSLPYYPKGCLITGIDISEDMLHKARQKVKENGRNQVDLFKMDASSLSFDDESFDRVLVPYLISVVPDPYRVVSEIIRVCRRGGLIVFVNHFQNSNPVIALLEKCLSPFSKFVGFRLDLPVESVTDHSPLRLERMEKVNLFGLWRLIKLKKE
jgi:phosphatidylethanolamine/phosphatidyl-N-methylethanolamine N-methyltransferase